MNWVIIFRERHTPKKRNITYKEREERVWREHIFNRC